MESNSSGSQWDTIHKQQQQQRIRSGVVGQQWLGYNGRSEFFRRVLQTESPGREQQGQTHQNLGQKQLHQWRKWIESDKVREVSSNQTRYITGFDANYRTEPKTKIMASGPITSWEIDGETVETVSDFIFGGSKITADGDCSHEIKRCLLLGRKVMTNLDSILKSRDITLPTKVCLVKAMVFPVVMYGCESWTVKKAERRKIDAFELWYWRRLLRFLGLQGDITSPS